MGILDKFCPKCMNIIHRKDVRCSNCGMLVSDMKKQKELKEKKVKSNDRNTLEEKQFNNKTQVTKEPIVTEIDDGGAIVDTSVMFNADLKEEVKNDKVEKNQNNYEQDFSEDLVGSVVFENETKPKRHKHKKKQKNQDTPQYTVDEDGTYNIDTTDVTYLEGIENPTPSIKKARGDGYKEKIEWWEIYKWADRMLARRKINKEVNKAAKKIPTGIKKGVMLTWCIFFGWLGIHDFYGGNKKKGWTVVIFYVIATIVVNVPILDDIMGVFVGGGLGFVVLALWFTDLFGIIFNKYKYRISKEEFISNLNVETRAKLSNKYIDLDKAVFAKKEEQRLNKKAIKKERRLKKKQQRQEKKALKEKQKAPNNETKNKQKTNYQVVTHKMDE